MTSYPIMTRGDQLLLPSESLLWRSVPAGYVDGGKLSSQSFQLSSSDDGRLSVAQSAHVLAEAHLKELTNDPFELQSTSVWAVSLNEIDAEGTHAVEDSKGQDPPDPCPTGHAFIEYRDLPSINQQKKRAQRFRDSAKARGQVYPVAGTATSSI